MGYELKIDPKYSCDNCGDVHDDSDDAFDCCKPTISEFYRCPFCHEDYQGHVDALNCCAERFEAGEEPRFRCPKTIDMFSGKS